MVFLFYQGILNQTDAHLFFKGILNQVQDDRTMNPARHPELDSGSPKINCTVILNLIQDPPR
ncbi:MAG TPA: hypothetical protein PKA29_02290 [Candidatus Saccharibacteria bacterium]|nr:hypothetical protein [Candidatus Saccharibacteria bacterium]